MRRADDGGEAGERVPILQDQRNRKNVIAPKRVASAQFNALVRKSFVLQWRQYKTNLCQILFPLLLIFMLFGLQILVDSFIQSSVGAVTPAIPHPWTVPGFLMKTNDSLNCAPTFGPPSYNVSQWQPADANLFYVDKTGYGNETQEILAGLVGPFNPALMLYGQVFIPQGNRQNLCLDQPLIVSNFTRVEQPSEEAADKTLLENFRTSNVIAGVVFETVSMVEKTFLFKILFNETITQGLDLPYLISLFGRSWARSLNPDVEIVFMGTKDFPTPEVKNTFDLISIVGSFLYVFVFQLIFPVLLSGIVYEKEERLREIMKMMGLDMSIYWVVTYIFTFCLYMISILIMWAVAAALGLRFYTVNSPACLFLFIFVWGNLLSASSFFLSVFFAKSRTATIVGYIYVFASGLLAAQVITQYFTADNTPQSILIILTMVPTFALYRCLLILSNEVSFGGSGLSLSDMWSSNFGVTLLIMAIEWLVLMILAGYFETVLPSGYGIKKHPLFFLQKSYWSGEKHNAKNSSMEIIRTRPNEPADVSNERSKLLNKSDDFALEINELYKIYPGADGVEPKVAVNYLSMGISNGECFGFLGPNGAGKSTTINIISGLYPPTSGSAKVFGYDINYNIDSVHMLMGVCPQDNVLWGELTGMEHLLFYGRLKNMRGKQLQDAVAEGLNQVDLWDARGKKSRDYSGGMKRRLSVACALMGNPKIVLLDEPSTGLDPASRRQLWNVITAYKQKCAILLTTHAMEEAEALCDRLAIFVSGELQCVGASSELKARYGKGYRLTITFQQNRGTYVHEFVMRTAPDAKLMNKIATTYNYELSRKDTSLAQLFSAFESNKATVGIVDWGISNTTLEEVFLNIVLKPDDN